MASRKLEVQIIGDASQLNRAFGQAGQSAQGFGSKMAKVGKIAAVGLGAGMVVAAVGMKKAVTAASDLNEQVNKAGVVFGKSGDEVVKWSGGLARSFGLSSRAALEAAGNFGNMLVPMGFGRDKAAGMSKKMVELAGDLASFNNVPVPEALEKIRAGLAGESEPLRTMGVFLSDARIKAEAMAEGLYKGKGPLDASAKAAATYALILKDTKDAQGDFAKTNDGLANAQRSLSASWENISASIGAKFLPALAGAAAGAADFLEKLSKADGASAKFHVVIDTMKSLATDAWTSLKTAFNAIQWGQIWDSVKDKISAVDWNATARAVGDKLVQALNGLSAAIARVDWTKVGQAIGEGIKKGAAALASVDWGSLIVGFMNLQQRLMLAIGKVLLALVGSLASGLMELVRSGASAAAAAAMQAGKDIGMAVMRGIGAGVDALMSWALGKMGGIVTALKDKLLFWESPPEAFGFKVGMRLITGVAAGMDAAKVDTTTKVGAIVAAIIERAQAVIESKRASFGAAWDTLASAAEQAFDAVYAKIPTKSEKALAKLQADAAAASRAGAIIDAKAGLAEAQASGDPAAILAAQKQLNDALLAQKEFALQQSAAKERLQLNARIALRREHFQTALTNLQTHLTAEGATHQKAHTAIMALFKKFGVEYSDAGAALGDAFAAGLRSKTKAVQDAAEALAAAAARPIKLRSPAEVGPLAQLDHFWDKFVPTLTSGLNLSGMTAAVAGAVTFPSPASFGGGAATSGPTIIRLVLDGRVISEVVRNDLIQVGRRNGSALGGFA